MTERRGLLIGVIIAALLVGGLVDRHGRSRGVAAAATVTSPQARPAGSAAASTWYCPVGIANPDSDQTASVAIQNATAKGIDATVTMMPNHGDATISQVKVPAASSASVREVGSADAMGAVVEIARGGVGVDETITSSIGESTTACASSTSDRWYVADGSTALGNTMLLHLFNPFPEDAIVDMDFATEQGPTAPGDFQGVVVPARSVVALNVGDHVRRRDHVAATIKARRGRIVVGREQLRTSPLNGLLVTLGAPQPSTSWDFPEGFVSDKVGEHLNLYNPSGRDATVEVALTLDQGAAEPLEVKVPTGDRVTLDLGAESRVPKGVGHALAVRSTAPIVAERTLDFMLGSGRTGLGGALGATTTARRWLLPQGGVSDKRDDYVTVHNPGRNAVRVSLAIASGGASTRPDGLTGVRVAAGERRVFNLRDVVRGDNIAVVVDASGPVVVERDLSRVGRGGVNVSVAIPVASS